MLSLVLFLITLFYGIRVIVYGVCVIKEKNFSGGFGLFVLSLVTFAAAAVSAVEYFK